MSLTKILKNSLIIVPFSLGLACGETRIESNPETKVGVLVTPGKPDSLQTTVLNISSGGAGGAFQDITGDGKPDVVFQVYYGDSWDENYIFFRENLGNGSFGSPKFLYKVRGYGVNNRPELPQRGLNAKSSEGQYFWNLIRDTEKEYMGVDN